MTIPTIDANPSRERPDEFWDQAEQAWPQLSAAIGGINLALTTIDSAVATVTAALSAPLWVSGTSYAIGDLRTSPATGFLYRRLTAGAGTTDPSADGTNWALRTVMGLPLVVVSGTTHTAAVNTYCVLANAAATELTAPPAMSVGQRFGVRPINGRWDNVLKGNAQPLEGGADDLMLDWFGSFGVYQKFSAGYGIGKE